MRRIDIIGNKYSRLTVISVAATKTKSNHILYNCQCECGGTAICTGSALKLGNTRSCGCYQKERISAANKKDHDTKSSEYSTWSNMKDRCSNPKNNHYDYYGGRGISVCERWKSFPNFLEDMGPKPTPKHSLDRYPNVNGDYGPDNCRWATTKEQGMNKRNNLYFDNAGQKIPLKKFLQDANMSIIKFRYLHYEKRLPLNQIFKTHYHAIS